MASLLPTLTRAKHLLSSRALTKPTSSNLLHPNWSPFLTRSIHVSTNDDPGSQIINPFQISGPKGNNVTKIDYMGMHIRIDMPGVDKDFELWVEKDKGILLYKAKAPYDRREKNDDYLYMGHHNVPTECYKLDQIKAKLKDGVLRVLIPLKY